MELSGVYHVLRRFIRKYFSIILTADYKARCKTISYRPNAIIIRPRNDNPGGRREPTQDTSAYFPFGCLPSIPRSLLANRRRLSFHCCRSVIWKLYSCKTRGRERKLKRLFLDILQHLTGSKPSPDGSISLKGGLELQLYNWLNEWTIMICAGT